MRCAPVEVEPRISIGGLGTRPRGDRGTLEAQAIDDHGDAFAIAHHLRPPGSKGHG